MTSRGGREGEEGGKEGEKGTKGENKSNRISSNQTHIPGFLLGGWEGHLLPLGHSLPPCKSYLSKTLNTFAPLCKTKIFPPSLSQNPERSLVDYLHLMLTPANIYRCVIATVESATPFHPCWNSYSSSTAKYTSHLLLFSD